MKYPKPWMNWLVNGLRIITLGTVGLLGLYALLGLQIVRIPGEFTLMEPDFKPGDSVMVKPVLPFTGISRGDVVIYDTGSGSAMARVAGLPAETVEVNGSRLKINDSVITYPFLSPLENPRPAMQIGPIKLNSREYFLLADKPWDLEDPAGAWDVVPSGALNGIVLMHF